MNLKKPAAFLFPNNKHVEKKIVKTLPFIIASKYLRIILTQEVKDL